MDDNDLGIGIGIGLGESAPGHGGGSVSFVQGDTTEGSEYGMQYGDALMVYGPDFMRYGE